MHLIAYSDTRMQFPIRINYCKAKVPAARVTTPATGSDTTSSVTSISGCGASAQDWFEAQHALASVAFSFCCVMFAVWDSGRLWEHSVCTICSMTFCRRRDQKLQSLGGPLGESLGLVSDKLSVSHANRFSCNPIVCRCTKDRQVGSKRLFCFIPRTWVCYLWRGYF